MFTERISVIVPIYCVEQYLTRCIDSIRRQTYTNLEIILVDDGSPDGCGQICDDYARMDERIKVVHKKNGGLGYARNSGLEVATGEYVTFIDSDDWISDTHIENLYRPVKDQQADMVMGAYTMVRDDGFRSTHAPHLEGKTICGTSIIDELLLTMIAPEPKYARDVLIESSVWANLYRLSIIQNHGLRFISEKDAVAEDLHFNVDFFCFADRVTIVNEPGYYYFYNSQSITRKYDPNRSRRTVNFYDSMKKKVKVYGLEEKAMIRIDRCYLVKVRVAIRLIVLASMPVKEKLKQIRSILRERVTQDVLAEYPIHTLIPAMRLLTILMKKQSAWGVYCLMKLREGIGQKGAMKKILKAAGISR